MLFHMIKGLATAIYQVPDIGQARAWYARVFDASPYFDEPFYVGFNIGGYELGLHPDEDGHRAGPGGTVAYWRVAALDAAVERFAAAGAPIVSAIQDVGEGIRVATVADPFGNLIGLIENPHFALPGDGD
jgi:predicted enzyme related to lactoylglutathione lyase